MSQMSSWSRKLSSIKSYLASPACKRHLRVSAVLRQDANLGCTSLAYFVSPCFLEQFLYCDLRVYRFALKLGGNLGELGGGVEKHEFEGAG
jgi:hypothetical protein